MKQYLCKEIFAVLNIGTIKLPYMCVNRAANVTYKTLPMWIYYQMILPKQCV